jgi:hypothetical protein
VVELDIDQCECRHGEDGEENREDLELGIWNFSGAWMLELGASLQV